MELLSVASMGAAGKNETTEERQRFSLSQGMRKLGDKTTTATRKLRTIPTRYLRGLGALSGLVEVDKEDFQDLVDNLDYFNSFLMGLLDSTNKRSLKRVDDTNYLELLQIRDDVKSLKSLIKALDRDYHRVAGPSLAASWDNEPLEAALRERRADVAKKYLRSLTELKIRHIEVDQLEESPKPIATLLDFSSFEFYQNDLESLREGHQKRRCVATWVAYYV
ncbi:hypothetical protein GGR53DRAFT_526030 [Hypoxylon sp. FL1150]|nr:hypothetical protein GGR53DRAFT_526030 [Hypoxylon sp. FL1150]